MAAPFGTAEPCPSPVVVDRPVLGGIGREAAGAEARLHGVGPLRGAQAPLFHVTACYVAACHVTACHVTACHVTACYVAACYVTACHVTACIRLFLLAAQGGEDVGGDDADTEEDAGGGQEKNHAGGQYVGP